MSHAWDAEHTVHIHLACALIEKAFPDLQVSKIELLGEGWDNIAYLVNAQLVFRFPRRSISVPLLQAESCILPKIAGQLPLQVPMPKWIGSPGHGYPWPFIGYKLLDGITACQATLSKQERTQLAPALAQFLAKLHAIPLFQGQECRLQNDTLGRLNSKRLIPLIEKNLQELAALKLIAGVEQFEPIISPIKKYITPQNSVIVHGDFYVRHLLLDKQRHLTGVIDWGDVHIGDPAIDLSIAHSFLPKEAHAAFIHAYGKVSAETWELACLRALYHSTILTLYGYHSNDQSIAQEGLRSLEFIGVAS